MRRSVPLSLVLGSVAAVLLAKEAFEKQQGDPGAMDHRTLCSAAALVLAAVLVRFYSGAPFYAEPSSAALTAQGVEASAPTGAVPEPASPAKKVRKRRSKAKQSPVSHEETAAAERQPLARGEQCWHSKLNVMCEVTQVYHDDPESPYYVVRSLDDGSERNSVRARLQTLEERAAAVAVADAQDAADRADANAGALVAEEAAAAVVATRRRNPPRRGSKR